MRDDGLEVHSMKDDGLKVQYWTKREAQYPENQDDHTVALVVPGLVERGKDLLAQRRNLLVQEEGLSVQEEGL